MMSPNLWWGWATMPGPVELTDPNKEYIMLEGLKLRIRRWKLERESDKVALLDINSSEWEDRFDGLFEEHIQLTWEERAHARR